MGLKQTILKNIIGESFGLYVHPKPTLKILSGSIYPSLYFEVYKELDGQLQMPPLRFGSWDISTKDFIIEFDEEQHFNRYRQKTLDFSFYNKWTGFSVDKYKYYCLNEEKKCLKKASHGGYWQTTSTEKQFGKSDNKGTLLKLGSSRWKQRAYYDFLKDISSTIINVPILRISIYDTFKNITIDKMLALNDKTLILDFLDHRLSK